MACIPPKLWSYTLMNCPEHDTKLLIFNYLITNKNNCNVKTFLIFHPSTGAINHEMKSGVYKYDLIHSLEANSLKDAFKLAQNDFSEEYALLDKRSTCIGDVIVNLDDQRVHHMVAGTGFIDIPRTVITYVPWYSHMEDLKNECELNALENQSPEC